MERCAHCRARTPATDFSRRCWSATNPVQLGLIEFVHRNSVVNSAVTMVTPDLTKTEVQLDRGVAEVEVDQLYKQNDILIDQGPAQAVLLKDGLYEFDATANQVRVFDGPASVSPAQNAKKWITLKDHHSLAIKIG